MFFKRSRLFIAFSVIALLISLYLKDKIPEIIVIRALKQFSAGDLHTLRLDERDIDNLQCFSDFTVSHNFEPPFVSIEKVNRIDNRVQVAVFYTWIEYGLDGSVNDNYSGVLFNLIKKSPIKWQIEQVKIIGNITSGSQVDDEDYPEQSIEDGDVSPEHDDNAGYPEVIPEENYADAISVLCYHHIIPVELPKTATTKAVVPLREFEEQMKFLHESGYNTLNLKEVENFIYDKQNLPQKSVLITFDDGYESNYVYALPIMQKYDLKFTVFLIGKEVKEENREAFNPDKLTYLTSTQIKEMASTGIVEFANHTYNLHRYINKSAAIFSKTRQEIADDFELMSELFQTLDLPLPVTISYPYGVHNEEILESSKDKGYKLCFTIQEGQVQQDSEPFKLNRFIVPPGITLEQFEKMINPDEELSGL